MKNQARINELRDKVYALADKGLPIPSEYVKELDMLDPEWNFPAIRERQKQRSAKAIDPNYTIKKSELKDLKRVHSELRRLSQYTDGLVWLNDTLGSVIEGIDKQIPLPEQISI